MDESRPQRLSCRGHRQRGCRSYLRSSIAFLLILFAIGFSFDASRDSKSRGSPPHLFVSSFTSTNRAKSQWKFSTIQRKRTKRTREENIFSVSQHVSARARCRSQGAVSALPSADSSPTTKPPAPTDWVVVEEYPIISPEGIDPYAILKNNLNSEENAVDDKYLTALERLNVTQYNLTLPIVIMNLDRERYPTLSNARKACRQGKIAFRLSSIANDSSLPPFRKGLVGDRVYPLDCLVRRELYKNLVETNDPNSYGTLGDGFVKSKFQNLHVAYEDDCMAVVVKPAGLLVHPQGKNGGWGRKNNVLNALPYFLKKPVNPFACNQISDDDNSVLDQPVPVHRLDFATSGLLVAAKTKGASRLLAQEFEYRKARKTYTAMVYGIPMDKSTSEPSMIPSFLGQNVVDGDDSVDGKEIVVSAAFTQESTAAKELETEDIDNEDGFMDDADSEGWNLADCFLDNKRARTLWRVLGSHNCSVPIYYLNSDGEKDQTVHAINVPVSIVEMKPKTGRYHQLRRTMAWLYNTPMVGDPVYATDFLEENYLPENAELKEQQQNKDYRSSLMLCSNEIDVAHPYFNTEAGRREWEKRKDELCTTGTSKTGKDQSSSSLYENENGIVRVTASIQLPKKFTKFIGMMERKKMQHEI